MKQIAWVKVIQNKYVKRCMSIVGIVIVLLGAMLLYHITGLRKNEYTKKEPLLLNWTVVSENQTDTDVDLNTFRFDNILTDKKTLYLSRTFVDKGQFQSPVLVVQTHNTTLRVFVDGECIYSFGLERYDCGKMVGSGTHSIAMPKDGERHELMLEFKANGDSYVTRMNDIYITDYATIYTDFLVSNRVTYALSVCLLFVGFVLLLLGMVMMLTRTWFTHLISLGICSLMVGLWTMGKYNILQIYRVPIWLCTFIEYASLYIGPPFLLLFFRDYPKKADSRCITWMYYIIFWVDSCVTALLFVLHFSGVWHLPHMLRLEQAFVAIVCVYLIILMIACVRKGNRQSRLVICGVILFLLCIGVEWSGYMAGKYWGHEMSWATGFSSLGTVILISILLLSLSWDIAGKMVDEKEQAVLYKMAYTDNLTGLYNRRFCEERLKSYCYNNIPFTIFNFDMNGLKATNDTHGHSSGDKLIKGFADILTKTFGDKGIVGRMGGDEFIVIVENIEELNCQEEIRHFQKIMSEANKAQSGYVYSTAYGYADSSEIVSDGEIRDVNMVYRLADNRMYENKKTCHDARK